MEAAAVTNASAAEVSAAFQQRMAQMQNELKEMQKVEQSLKEEDGRSQKALTALQKELETVSRDITTGERRRQRLQQELKDTEAELLRLQERKKDVSAKIYDVTNSAEQKRADKLRAVGLTGQQSVSATQQAPAPNAQPNAAPAQSALAEPDLLGGLADLDFTNTEAPSVDLVGSTDLFSPQAPQVASAASNWQANSTPSQAMLSGFGGCASSAVGAQASNGAVFNAYGQRTDMQAVGGFPSSGSGSGTNPNSLSALLPGADSHPGNIAAGGMMHPGMMPGSMMPNGGVQNPIAGGNMPGMGMAPGNMGLSGMSGSMMPGGSMGSMMPGGMMAPGNMMPGAGMHQGGMAAGSMMPTGPGMGPGVMAAGGMPLGYGAGAPAYTGGAGCYNGPPAAASGARPPPPAQPPQPDPNFLSLLGMGSGPS